MYGNETQEFLSNEAPESDFSSGFVCLEPDEEVLSDIHIFADVSEGLSNANSKATVRHRLGSTTYLRKYVALQVSLFPQHCISLQPSSLASFSNNWGSQRPLRRETSPKSLGMYLRRIPLLTMTMIFLLKGLLYRARWFSLVRGDFGLFGVWRYGLQQRWPWVLLDGRNGLRNFRLVQQLRGGGGYF